MALELLAAACGIKSPDQGSNLGPLHWELRVLATGPLGSPSPAETYVVINIFHSNSFAFYFLLPTTLFKEGPICGLQWLLVEVKRLMGMSACPSLLIFRSIPLSLMRDEIKLCGPRGYLKEQILLKLRG